MRAGGGGISSRYQLGAFVFAALYKIMQSGCPACANSFHHPMLAGGWGSLRQRATLRTAALPAGIVVDMFQAVLAWLLT
jgi:hypothetical protein